MHNDLASSAPGAAAAHPTAGAGNAPASAPCPAAASHPASALRPAGAASRPAAEPAAATGDLAAAKTAGPRRGRRIGTALLALLAIALLGIYVPRIFPYDFWSDECFSVLLSHMGFKEMLAATAADVHPPFFYAVLMALYRLFGDQAWAYGLASLIPYGAMLLFSLTFVRGKFGNGVAACTMLCCAFMHNAITYNTELRMYSWTAFFVFACFCLLYSCLEKRSWPAHIALGVCAALASYCHYYGFLAAGLILFALMVIAIARRKHVVKMITTCAIALALYLPWLLVLLDTFKRSSDGFWLQNIPSLSTCLLFPFQLGRGKLVGMVLLAAFFVLFAITLYTTRRRARQDHGCHNDQTLVLRTWLVAGMFAWLGTILVGLGLSHAVHPFLITRYLFPIAPIAWLMLSVMASRALPKPYLVWGIALLVALVGAPSYARSLSNAFSRYDFHEQTLDEFKDLIEPGDVLLTDTYALDWTVLSVYFPNNANDPFSSESAPELDPSSTYWLILENPDSLEDANKALEKQGYRAVDTGVSGIVVKYPVNLYRIEKAD